MTNIEIHRYAFGEDSTLGRMSIDGEFFCFTLEDERRRIKVQDETCIPPGTYQVKLRTEGGMNERYKAKFPETHKGMLWLQDVKDFTYVYIHIGNTDDHTSGCVLVGDVPICLPDGEFKIAKSTDAYLRLYKRIVAEKVAIHITEDERST